MKAPLILSTAFVLTGHLVIGSSLAAPLAGTNMVLPALHRATPNLLLVQGAEPEAATRDRVTRLWQHRSLLENALRPPGQAMPAEPFEPQARALQTPEPMRSIAPQEPTIEGLPAEPELAAEALEQVSCEAAAGIVEEYGFSEIRPADCSGDLYRFSATRDGTAYSIGITAAAGEIAEVSRE